MTTERTIQAGVVIADMIVCYIRSRVVVSITIFAILLLLSAIVSYWRDKRESKADKARLELARRSGDRRDIVDLREVQQESGTGEGSEEDGPCVCASFSVRNRYSDMCVGDL